VYVINQNKRTINSLLSHLELVIIFREYQQLKCNVQETINAFLYLLRNKYNYQSGWLYATFVMLTRYFLHNGRGYIRHLIQEYISDNAKNSSIKNTPIFL